MDELELDELDKLELDELELDELELDELELLLELGVWLARLLVPPDLVPPPPPPQLTEPRVSVPRKSAIRILRMGSLCLLMVISHGQYSERHLVGQTIKLIKTEVIHALKNLAAE